MSIEATSDSMLHTQQEDSGSNLIETLARVGYFAKGAVYATVGLLALSALFNWFGVDNVQGTRGAIETIASQPFGGILLVALIVGLIGYTIWRFTQGIADTEDKGGDASGWMQRIGFMISGTMYAALAFYAVTLTGWFSSSGGSGSSQKQDLLSTVMSTEGGILAVGAFGVGFVLVGLYQGYRALTKKFKDNWKTARLSASEERIATRLGQAGIGIRAVTFVIIGSLVTKAAMDADPAQATGLGAALGTIASQPYGQILLAAAGIGLMCYGVYCFVNARYRAMTIH